MAPAQHRGIGEEEERNGNELGAKTAKGRCKRLAHQRIVLHAYQHTAALNVHHAGGQDDQCREGADHNGVCKDLKHAPHALLDGFFHIGGGIDHDGRAKAGLVGERAPLEAPGQALADAVAQRAAACGLQVERAPEDGPECRRDVARVEHHDDDSTHDVEQCHEGHQFFGDSGHPLEAAQHDEGRDHHQRHARDEVGRVERGVHVARDGIDLAHVADAERCQNAETGKQHRQHLAQRFAAFLCAQAVGQVVHGTAGPLAFFIFAAVVHAQHVFRKAGHHTQNGHDPHPEDGARPARDDGRGHTHDVAGANGARQRRAHALELADGHVLFAGVGGDLLVGKHRANGVPHPVAHPAELEAAGAQCHPQAGAEQQRQPDGPPDDAVDHPVDLRDPLYHTFPSLYTKTLWNPRCTLSPSAPRILFFSREQLFAIRKLYHIFPARARFFSHFMLQFHRSCPEMNFIMV